MRGEGLHLHALVCLVHKLEELVDDGLEESPVGPQEPGARGQLS